MLQLSVFYIFSLLITIVLSKPETPQSAPLLSLTEYYYNLKHGNSVVQKPKPPSSINLVGMFPERIIGEVENQSVRIFLP